MTIHDDSCNAEASVTTWIVQLQAGDPQASGALWQRYVKRLIDLAKRKLSDTPRRMADEEDVVQSAFDAFFLGVDEGRFSRLDNREDLWQILVMLTERKATGLIRYNLAEKRGDGQVRGDSGVLPPNADESASGGMHQVASVEPSPEFAVEFADYLRASLDRLGDEQQRQVALAKLEGLTNPEVAERLDISLRGVERKLRLIRRKWGELSP